MTTARAPVVLVTGTSTGPGLATAVGLAGRGCRVVATLGVVAAHGRLDAVVSNAGIAHIGALEHDDLDDVRRVMETDFLGVVRVARAALPHLRRSRGRPVTVTSVGGVVGQPFADAYCASKSAVEGLLDIGTARTPSRDQRASAD